MSQAEPVLKEAPKGGAWTPTPQAALAPEVFKVSTIWDWTEEEAGYKKGTSFSCPNPGAIWR